MSKKIIEITYRTRWMAYALLSCLVVATCTPIYYDPLRFWWRPVAVMQGEVKSRTGTGVILHIYGQKLRGPECKFIEFQTFGDRLAGLPVDLYMLRVDGLPNDGKTKPAGSYDIGLWSVYPTLGVNRVRVYAMHDCDGVQVATEIANVQL